MDKTLLYFFSFYFSLSFFLLTQNVIEHKVQVISSERSINLLLDNIKIKNDANETLSKGNPETKVETVIFINENLAVLKQKSHVSL